MKPESINSNVRQYLQLSQFTTEEDTNRVLRLGLIAVTSSQFLEHIAFTVGSEGVYFLNEFYRNFLGMHDLVCVEKSLTNSAIRFCTQVSPNAVDGVQLSFIQHSPNTSHRIILHKLTASFDATTIAVLKEYK